MPGPVLYSTNVFLKYHINERFYGGRHYVWCSETFDSTKHGYYAASALTAPSSDPCAIYKDLASACQRIERHNAKIAEQRASFNALAIQFRDEGKITPDVAEEIIYMATSVESALWRPVIYVIPRSVVVDRLKLVEPPRRASIGIEYIIQDLSSDEFDLIEL